MINKEGTTMKVIDFRPPRIAMLFGLAAAALHWGLPVWNKMRFSYPVFGAVTAAGGFMAMMWGWWLFKKHDVAICPTQKTVRLVTRGIYRFTRNPMYLGFILMLLGLAFFVGTPPFYLAAGAYFVLINWVFCPYEEAKLTGTFGQEFLNYKARVRRWL
jgi:protein-S-isoprenylcysteine O-methyltransferase Ste14